MTDRIVALIDMDCFYCQVETRLNPQWQGLPLAVVQYNEWKGGGIIAVNYEARDRGVTRHMRGADAKEQCPEIILAKVPTLRDKADLTRYREAGREVVSVLCTFSECVERASVDEAYVDLTAGVERRIAEKSSHVSANELANTFIVGYTKENSNNEDERTHGLNSWLNDVNDSGFQDIAAQKLAVGAAIVEEMRRAVYETTGFKCSAGIAHNKILAKLSCGLHKPNRQTVTPQSSVPGLYNILPPKKIRSLGGKLGDDLANRLGIKVMADLVKFSESELQKIYDTKTGTWLFNIARGYDYDVVTPRLLSKSIGCCKKFPGRTALKTSSDINHWITKLAEELLERLKEDQSMNKRRAQLLTLSMSLEVNKKDTGSTKSLNLNSYNLEKIVTATYNVLRKVCTEDPNTKMWSPPIKYLGLSAGKFVNETANKINNFFKTTATPCGEVSSIKLRPKEECPEALSIERKILNEVSNNNINNEIVNNIQLEEEKLPSFFEKMLFQGISNNTGKLNILPDLNRIEDLSDDNSRDSCVSDKLINSINPVIDTPRKDIKSSFQKLDSSETNSVINRNNTTNKEECEYSKTEQIKNKTKTNKKTISYFFSASAVKEKWINPQEVFPDLKNIDNEVLEMFPPSFRKKIIELKLQSNESCSKDLSTCSEVIKNDIVHCSEEKHTTEEEKSQLNINPNTNVSPNNDVQLGFIKCNECGENVPIKDHILHLDLHVAKKLDNELNNGINNAAVNYKMKNIINTQTNNKRKTKSNHSNSKIIKKTKNIEAFFK